MGTLIVLLILIDVMDSSRPHANVFLLEERAVRQIDLETVSDKANPS
jgi:hypothetical protein